MSVDIQPSAVILEPSGRAEPNVAAAIERPASHLHPTPSYDLADHPRPTGLEEIWRFTPLKRLRSLLEATVDETGASAGRLDRSVQAPAGVTTSEIPTAEAIALGGQLPVDRVAALAVANSGTALRVDIPDDAELHTPVLIELTGRGLEPPVFGHTVVTVGAHARATVILEHRGSAQYAGVVQVVVGDGARVDVVGMQLWADDAVHGGHIGITVGRDAQVRSVAVSLGGSLVRLVETAEYAGPGGSIEQLGLYFVDAGQHIEHRLFVDHNAPHTRSNVDYRGALQGQGAHAVWIGDVLIRKVAEGIETYESNKNLVLTDGCRADSVPNLEIETGEIAGAGHASTTGRFDDEQLFYLRSRGIEETEARRLVVHGFFADIIRKIGIPSIEERLLEAVEAELAVTVGLPQQEQR